MSGWYAGLTPSRLPGITNPPRKPRPLCSEAAAEAAPRTPRAAASESVMNDLLPIIVTPRWFAEAIVPRSNHQVGRDPCGRLSGTIHFRNAGCGSEAVPNAKRGATTAGLG